MSKNNMIEAMRAPRSVSQDSLKVWTQKDPDQTDSHVRLNDRRLPAEPHVSLQAAFGLGPQQPPRRR